MSADQPPADRVRILTVCTGNICRSPYAQVVLGAGLEWARPGAFEVTSAGTHALVDHGVDAGSAALLDAKGLPHDTFRARRLTPALLAQQDLVLVMAGHHKEYVVDEAPSVHRRTLTLRELAGALDDIEEKDDWPWLLSQAGADDVVSRWRALPGLIAAHRSRGRRRGERDVADPYQRGEKAFARMAGEIDPAVRTIVSWERRLGR
ncbi:low molecular weight phosphatase family protein [Oryzobacter telluris]|uniref:arsenate reductase/protein-tyrosine-phosphatase family protein n=1 Tax=Oryzobacter telluris TaxID=3149179 RepID=UPI00370D800E